MLYAAVFLKVEFIRHMGTPAGLVSIPFYIPLYVFCCLFVIMNCIRHTAIASGLTSLLFLKTFALTICIKRGYHCYFSAAIFFAICCYLLILLLFKITVSVTVHLHIMLAGSFYTLLKSNFGISEVFHAERRMQYILGRDDLSSFWPNHQVTFLPIWIALALGMLCRKEGRGLK